jgi:hypothetical protein
MVPRAVAVIFAQHQRAVELVAQGDSSALGVLAANLHQPRHRGNVLYLCFSRGQMEHHTAGNHTLGEAIRNSPELMNRPGLQIQQHKIHRTTGGTHVTRIKSNRTGHRSGTRQH